MLCHRLQFLNKYYYYQVKVRVTLVEEGSNGHGLCGCPVNGIWGGYFFESVGDVHLRQVGVEALNNPKTV